jgi:hypothetical protein
MVKKKEEDLDVREVIYKTTSMGEKEAKVVKKKGCRFLDYIPKPR